MLNATRGSPPPLTPFATAYDAQSNSCVRFANGGNRSSPSRWPHFCDTTCTRTGRGPPLDVGNTSRGPLQRFVDWAVKALRLWDSPKPRTGGLLVLSSAFGPAWRRHGAGRLVSQWHTDSFFVDGSNIPAVPSPCRGCIERPTSER